MPINTETSRYGETGHCLIRGSTESKTLERLQRDLQKAIDTYKAQPSYQLLKTRQYRDFANGLHITSEAVVDFLRGPPFEAFATQVLGADVDLLFTSTMTKTKERPSALDWHQDSGYDKSPGHPRFSFWVAITDSKKDNGCLRIIPGSHLQGRVKHILSRNFPPDLEIETVDASLAEDVEMEPGDILALDPDIFHSSRPNHAGRLRMALIAGFMQPKKEYPDFEKKGSFRYLRGGRRVWSRVTD